MTRADQIRARIAELQAENERAPDAVLAPVRMNQMAALRRELVRIEARAA